MSTKQFFYPEVGAGGYSRVDGTVEFYSRINSLLRPEMTVLDFGAGRGKGPKEDPVDFRRSLMTLRGKCLRVIGIDVDPTVQHNTSLDQAMVVAPQERFPLSDESVDLIVSDHVFEHVLNPGFVARELERVLKPSGWICARTPNRWGYIGVGARLVPNKHHVSWLKYLQPEKRAEDTFPTAYRLNTLRALRQHFPEPRFTHHTYGYFSEPAYFGNSKAGWAIALAVFRFTPERFAPTYLCFMQKRSNNNLACNIRENDEAPPRSSLTNPPET